MAIEIISDLRPAANFKIVHSDDIEWEPQTSVILSNLIDSSDNVSLDQKIKQPGIPILDQDKIDELSEKGIAIPKDYIKIPCADEANQALQAADGTGNQYLDIVFSAIRSLQAEVARLRNSFKYGINSYTDARTAMAGVEYDYDTLAANEPLWAVEENDLSQIDDAYCDINANHSLVPKENVTTNENDLYIDANGASWIDSSDAVANVKSVPDAKLFLYLTTSNLNACVHLVNLLDDQQTINIDLSQLDISPSASHKFNILVAVSRAYKDTTTVEEKYLGHNFIWIAIANYETLNGIAEGYWTPTQPTRLHDNYIPLEVNPDGVSANRYYIQKVSFKDTDLHKFNLYSQYQNFQSSVSPVDPSDETYKYEVAHITIRSVSTIAVLKQIVKQLPENELIYCKDDNGLYIVSEKGKYKKISGSSKPDEDEGMTKQEIITWLEANGIHVTEDGGDPITISADIQLGQVTFINQDTGRAFNITCSPDGVLRSDEVLETTLASRLDKVEVGGKHKDIWQSKSRGFVGKLQLSEQYNTTGESPSLTNDAKLAADRVKIGAIYAPKPGATTFGCTHGYVELENTSDKDFQLDGCYLYFYQQSSHDGIASYKASYKLALKGMIPAGGTYLIRAKKYTDSSASNCIVNVNEYDQEWYVDGKLVDFTLDSNNTWLLAHGDVSCPTPQTDNTSFETLVTENTDADDDKVPLFYESKFIDVMSIGAAVVNPGSKGATISPWTGLPNTTAFSLTAVNDCIYKNTFELDPAKQAFQALNKYDSSRHRNGSAATDYQYVDLKKSHIEFPMTADKYDIAKYTPRASFSKKNVSSDKTSLDFEKPNMPTCSFGIDMHKTRCFNWVSTGKFDEYVWIRVKDSSEDWSRFESYKDDYSEDNCIFTHTNDHKEVCHFEQKNISKPEQKNAIYSRITNVFPGCGVLYTAHKCIVSLDTYLNHATEFEYVVGRKDKNGNPDPEHTTEKQTFTIYPKSYVPQVFQITDQQGFHWIEYQAWAAAAQELNAKIDSVIADETLHVMPVLINTGDMTQNGTRINEWLDYFNAGKCLFNHLEQMNVVGNNDLCGPDPTVLGTGDDSGKSNSYYFHVFYCYEVDLDDYTPIIKGKYVPSLYYFEHINGDKSMRFLMVNSEITQKNCETWFNLTNNGRTVNAYTGWEIKAYVQDTEPQYVADDFTTVYQMIHYIVDSWSYPKKNIVAVCHEMPFTVITNDHVGKNINDGEIQLDRSLNNTSLVGSHMNRMSRLDTKSNYWFSRLLESSGIKLCIGGHKHTYACTHPIRELYSYGDGKNSYQNGPMKMPSCLSSDTSISFSATVGLSGNNHYVLSSGGTPIDTSKFPIISLESIQRIDSTNLNAGIFNDDDTMYPYYAKDGELSGVTYFMLQATGYKLKSNKELPSPKQRFSYLLPKTTDNGKPASDQQYPMYSCISVAFDDSNMAKYSITLCRIKNILNDSNHTFTQQSYGSGRATVQYLAKGESDDDLIYGHWTDTERPIVHI